VAVSIRARSYHAPVAGYVGRCRVQAVFGRSAHLCTATGDVVTLSTMAYDGPLSIAIEPPLPVLRPGSEASIWIRERARYQSDAGLDIELTEARCWDVQVKALNWTRASLRTAVEVMDPYCAGSAFHENGQQGDLLRRSRDGLLRTLSKETSVDRHIERLVGLGPGLTPSGDDWLTGFTAGYVHLVGLAGATGPLPRLLPSLGRALRRRPRRTTAFSQGLLVQALRGVVCMPLLTLIRALDCSPSELEAAAGTASRLGHSSGADMLLGLTDVVRLLSWSAGQ